MTKFIIHREADRLDIKKRLIELHDKNDCEGVTVGASEHSVALPMEIEMVSVSNAETKSVGV